VQQRRVQCRQRWHRHSAQPTLSVRLVHDDAWVRVSDLRSAIPVVLPPLPGGDRRCMVRSSPGLTDPCCVPAVGMAGVCIGAYALDLTR
jgi:hypothetical protein